MITSAALIMVSVFFAFIINGDPTVKQFGVGMGVAVAVDATLVRCLLVPAVMVLLGRANWWFPRWLDRIVPNFSIEGEEWFRERDAAVSAPPAPRPRAHANDAGLGGHCMQIRRMFPLAPIAAIAVLATSAQASAPGWSTPHTVTQYRVGTYAAGANGQAVQLFGNGAVQTMTAQIRAIKSDATQGSAVGINAGAAGFDQPRVSVNASGRLVAAWTLDTEGTAPIGLAATLGSRSSLPKQASVLQTDGQSVSDVATAVDASGNGVVAWIQSPQGAPGSTTVKAATLRPGLAPQVVDARHARQREPGVPLARPRQRRATPASRGP